MDAERARAERFRRALAEERADREQSLETQADRMLAKLRKMRDAGIMPQEIADLPAVSERALELRDERAGLVSGPVGRNRLLEMRQDGLLASQRRGPPRKQREQQHGEWVLQQRRRLAIEVDSLTPIQRLVLMLKGQEVGDPLVADLIECMDWTDVATIVPCCRECPQRSPRFVAFTQEEREAQRAEIGEDLQHILDPTLGQDPDFQEDAAREEREARDLRRMELEERAGRRYDQWREKMRHVAKGCWTQRPDCLRDWMQPMAGKRGLVTETGIAKALGIAQPAVSQAEHAARPKLLAWARRRDAETTTWDDWRSWSEEGELQAAYEDLRWGGGGED